VGQGWQAAEELAPTAVEKKPFAQPIDLFILTELQ
jgi:hypothetical protein